MADVFISYSRQDRAVVGRLDAALQRAGIDTWVDYEDIPPSYDWLQQIKEGIDEASAVVCVLSDDYLDSEICTIESGYAEEAGKRIIPVVIEDLERRSMPTSVSTPNWILVESTDDLDETVQQLSVAITADPDWTRLHTRLVIRARDWDGAGRRRHGVLRGRELRAAAEAIDVARPAGQPQPTDLQRQFVAHSQHVASTRRAMGVGTAILAAAGLLVAGVLVLVERQRAQRSEAVADSQELAALAVEHLEDDHDLALLLAVEAAQTDLSREAYGTLIQAALHLPNIEHHLHGFDGQIRGAAFVAGGRRLVAAGEGGRLMAWSVDDGEPVADVRGGVLSIHAVAGSPDGERLATGDDSGNVILWDVETLESRHVRTADGSGGVRSLAFSPDGHLLAKGGADGVVEIWATDDLDAPLDSVLAQTTEIRDLAWSPDGGRLAVVHGRGVDILDHAAGYSLEHSIEIGEPSVASWEADSSALAVGGRDGYVHLYAVGGRDGADDDLIWRSTSRHDGWVTAIDHGPDGKVRSADSHGTVRVWNPPGDTDAEAVWTAHAGRITALVHSDGRFATTGVDGTTVLWTTGRSPGLFEPIVDYDTLTGLAGEPWQSMTAASLFDGSIVTHDEAASETIAVIDTVDGKIRDLVLAREGTVVIAVDDAGRIMQAAVDSTGGGPVQLSQGSSPVGAITTDRDGRLVSWVSDDGSVTLYDAASGSVLARAETELSDAVDMSLDLVRNELAIVGASERVTRLALDDLAPLPPLGSVHEDWIDAVAYSPDGSALVTGGSGELVVWELDTDAHRVLPDLHGARIMAMDFSLDGSLLATGDAAGTVILWAADAGWQPLGARIGLPEMSSGVEEIVFLPRGSLILAGGGLATVVSLEPLAVQDVLCDVANRALTDEEKERFGIRADRDDACATAVSSPAATRSAPSDGTTLDGEVSPAAPAPHVEATPGGQPVPIVLTGHTDWVFSVAWSPSGSLLASASGDRSVVLWDTTSGEPIGPSLTGHDDEVRTVAWSPDGMTLASAGGETIVLWDAAGGDPIGAPLTGHGGRINAVAWSPDGTRLASASGDGTVRIWDASGRESARGSPSDPAAAVRSVAWSPDGRRLAVVTMDGTIALWDSPDVELDPRLVIGSEAWTLAWSPDSTRLASGGQDKTIRLWNADTGDPIGEPLVGHDLWVNAVAWSPGGDRLASVSDDGTVRLWDPASGEQIGVELIGHTDSALAIAWSPDGQRVASAGADGTIRIWTVTS